MSVAVDEGDHLRYDVPEAVLIDDLLGSIDDVRVVNGDDLASPSLGAEHGQNSGSATYVQDNLILENMLVLVDEVPVSFSANSVFKHGLVNAWQLFC